MESSHKLTAYSVNKKVLSKVCMGSQPKGMTGSCRVESTIRNLYVPSFHTTWPMQDIENELYGPCRI